MTFASNGNCFKASISSFTVPSLSAIASASFLQKLCIVSGFDQNHEAGRGEPNAECELHSQAALTLTVVRQHHSKPTVWFFFHVANPIDCCVLERE